MMAINRGALASFLTMRSAMSRHEIRTEPPARCWNWHPHTPLRDTCGVCRFRDNLRGRLCADQDDKLEVIVPYALFENDERLTRPFRTEREVWEAAEQADLVIAGTDGEKILDNNFEIKPCEATPEELATPRSDIVFPERPLENVPNRNGSSDGRSPSTQDDIRRRSHES
jgi:hypothetical protein